MQFEQQIIIFRSPIDDKEGKSILATVAVGTGLAYGPIDEEGHVFDAIHVASGFRLGGFFHRDVHARSFLELILPLTDWTQEQEVLTVGAPDLAHQLIAAREKVTQEVNDTFQSLLSPWIVKDLQEEMMMSGLSLREIVENAIDVYLHDKNDQSFLKRVEREQYDACMRYPSFHSLHEAYAVILEEVDEFKTEVWKKEETRDYDAIRAELVQIAAMCARTEDDLL